MHIFRGCLYFRLGGLSAFVLADDLFISNLPFQIVRDLRLERFIKEKNSKTGQNAGEAAVFHAWHTAWRTTCAQAKTQGQQFTPQAQPWDPQSSTDIAATSDEQTGSIDYHGQDDQGGTPRLGKQRNRHESAGMSKKP